MLSFKWSLSTLWILVAAEFTGEGVEYLKFTRGSRTVWNFDPDLPVIGECDFLIEADPGKVINLHIKGPQSTLPIEVYNGAKRDVYRLIASHRGPDTHALSSSNTVCILVERELERSSGRFHFSMEYEMVDPPATLNSQKCGSEFTGDNGTLHIPNLTGWNNTQVFCDYSVRIGKCADVRFVMEKYDVDHVNIGCLIFSTDKDGNLLRRGWYLSRPNSVNMTVNGSFYVSCGIRVNGPVSPIRLMYAVIGEKTDCE